MSKTDSKFVISLRIRLLKGLQNSGGLQGRKAVQVTLYKINFIFLNHRVID